MLIGCSLYRKNPYHFGKLYWSIGIAVNHRENPEVSTERQNKALQGAVTCDLRAQ